MKGYFVTGIGTGVGKTLVSAILTEALHADYWKPIQAGDLDKTDTHFVQSIIANEQSVLHPERYRLTVPASPHYAAEVDGVDISLHDFQLPATDHVLIVEGAGGVMVPINDKDVMLDLMYQLGLPVVVVSHNYLGSINHTLLTVDAIVNMGMVVAGIVFNGAETPSTESIIARQTGVPILGRIDTLPTITPATIAPYVQYFRERFKDMAV